MNKLTQKVELIANLLIIVVAVLLIGVLVQRYFTTSSASSFPPQPQSQSINQLQKKSNSPIEIAGVDFSEKPKTLILALQAGCHYCTESAPFYKRLIQSAKDKNIKLIAVLPSSVEESADYLDKLGINDLEIKQSTLASLQVRGTPTLILTNENGEIMNSWIGKLKTEKEDEVISKL
jgi:thioredoxin-related protein